MNMEEKNDLQIEQLKNALKSIGKPCLNEMRRDSMKASLMRKIDSGVVQYVKEADKELEVPVYTKVLLKEKIMSAIVDVVQERFSWSGFFMFNKRLVSSMMLFVMVFGLFSFVNFDVNVARADAFTTLDNYNGDVVLYRKGEYVNIKKGMELFEDDSLITGDDAFAVVKFFDDSVSRLNSSTEIVVKKLARPRGVVTSQVEVEVLDGNVWSKVVNLVEDDSSFSVEAKDVNFSTKKGAFNVEVEEDGRVEVGVFDDVVQVKKDFGKLDLERGKKVILDDESVAIEEISDDEMKEDWIASNLNSDEEYLIEVEERLIVARMETLGVDDFDEVSFENTLREDAKLWLTFDDVKKSKIELELAEKKFVAAQLKLEDPRLEENERVLINEAIDNFGKEVDEFYSLVSEVSATDDEYASELEEYVEEKVLSQQKDLNLVSEEDASFEAKELVDSLVEKKKEVVAEKDDEKVVVETKEKDEDEDDLEEEEKDEDEKEEVEEAKDDLETVVPVIILEEREVKEVVEENYAEELGVTLDGDTPIDPLLRD